jgi:outer membrane protein assembly factor BamB
MRLSVTCTRCDSKYQLDASMRGKRMRCPNPICRAVFEVRDDNDPPAVVVDKLQPPPVQVTAVEKSIEPAANFPDDFPGDEEPAPVPTPLEMKKPEPLPKLVEPKPAKKPEAPPPKPVEVKRPEPVKRKPVPRPIEPEPTADFPDDFPGDDESVPAASVPALATETWQPEAWEAPPVREAVSVPAAAVAAPPEPTIATPARPRRWALWTILAMLLVLGGVGAASWWRINRSIATNEAERFEAAQKLYDKGEFADASLAMQKLHRDFPDSPYNKKYRFLAELSDVREAVYAPRETSDDLGKALQRVLQFAAMYKNDPLLSKEREIDLWFTLDDLVRQLTRSAGADKAPTQLALAKRAWAETKNFAAPANVSKAERERKLERDWTDIERMLADHQEREHVIATIKKHKDKATAANVEEAWKLAEKTKRQGDTQIRGLLTELFKAQRDQVTFEEDQSPAKAPLLDDKLPSLSVTPSVQLVRPVAASKPLVLALARGVLYALEPAKGELRWARRVGIDTHVLPLRVPADVITPELLLVLSSDQRSLSAVLAETGETLWQTPLSGACLGAPVLVDRQVLVATVAGRIDEIEIAEGRRLGSYHVGQPLTLGGVHQPGTPLVYFPADDFCLYVFDITKRTCTNILYTRHPAGSLRGLPILARGGKRDLLLLSQAPAPGRAEIKPYALPIEQAEQKPIEPMLAVAGLSASPWHDANRLAVLSETGLLSLWGFRQKGTRDPLLFPFLKQDFPLDTGAPGRCQIVHADAENLWTLTRGRLQRVETAFDPMTGPGLVARWTQPILLGNAIHAVQALREPDGRTILFVTAQADDHPTCVCSAIDGDEGKILWQRQLGALPQQAPQLVGGQIVFADALGLLSFQATEDKFDKPWRRGGDRLLQEPWSDVVHVLLTTENSFVRLSWPRGGTKLRVQQGQIPGAEKIRALDVPLPAVPHGTPALVGGFVLMPLQNGIIVRIDLQDGALINLPDDWRALGAEEQSRGHIVPLAATEFVATDGSRGLQRIASADGKTWRKRAAEKLSHRIVAPPVLVQEGGMPRLCVADASDTLTLLDADRLTVVQRDGHPVRWSMPGKITAGPFVRAGKIGCIAGKYLVWLDPNQDEALWEYFVRDIVGEPHLIDGVLVIADAAGKFLALDPANGTPLGPGLTLKANVAANAAPLPFGPGHAFVPLTDGTMVVMPLEKLRKRPTDE